jgi:hypothetical protein
VARTRRADASPRRLVEVDFGRHGITVVATEDLERAHT